jgi:hypothetical protein
MTAPEPTPYTPTDREVRSEYVWFGSVPARREAFDCWLAAHDERVRADERARVAQRVHGSTVLFGTLEHLCEEGRNPSTLADRVQDAVADHVVRGEGR